MKKYPKAQKKKNYVNSNIYFTMQKYNLKKNPHIKINRLIISFLHVTNNSLPPPKNKITKILRKKIKN